MRRLSGCISPAHTNTPLWLPIHWIDIAASSVRNIPPRPPVVAPSPTTEPATLEGKRSVADVKRFADHAWCAAVTTPSSTRQSVKLLV